MDEKAKQKVIVITPDYDDEANKESTSGNRAAIILSYLCGWIGALIVFLLEKQNRFIKWHALQALILGVFEVLCVLIISTILGLIPYIGWFFFSWLGYLLAFAAWVCGIVALVMACTKGKTFRIPGASQLADKWFKI
ncbi:MAG: DUF4870 domain-containing protein [Actinomycetota bacterium]|nr:DUF4870 domain-containing protein [Actinomycetota bacterium]